MHRWHFISSWYVWCWMFGSVVNLSLPYLAANITWYINNKKVNALCFLHYLIYCHNWYLFNIRHRSINYHFNEFSTDRLKERQLTRHWSFSLTVLFFKKSIKIQHHLRTLLQCLAKSQFSTFTIKICSSE